MPSNKTQTGKEAKPRTLANRYRVDRKLGSGSFGTVHLVEDLKSEDRWKVLKEIPVGDLQPDETVSAVREARLLSKLNHPAIVKFHDSFVDGEHFCIITEFCEDGDLDDKICERRKSGKSFSEPTIITWLVQLLLAVQYIHERRILHRDLKTRNIFLKSNRIKIGDFGISRILMGTTDIATTFTGTPYYMSPEVLQHEGYNAKSDIWSLGVILYELCSLKRAFQGQNLMGVMFKIVQNDPPPFPENYSKELAKIYLSILTKDPQKRPRASELLKNPFIVKQMEILEAKMNHKMHHGREAEEDSKLIAKYLSASAKKSDISSFKTPKKPEKKAEKQRPMTPGEGLKRRKQERADREAKKLSQLTAQSYQESRKKYSETKSKQNVMKSSLPWAVDNNKARQEEPQEEEHEFSSPDIYSPSNVSSEDETKPDPTERAEDVFNFTNVSEIPEEEALANTYYSQVDEFEEDSCSPSESEGESEDEYGALMQCMGDALDLQDTCIEVDDAPDEVVDRYSLVASRSSNIKALRQECTRVLGPDEFKQAYDYLNKVRFDSEEALLSEESVMSGLKGLVTKPHHCFLVDQLLFLERQEEISRQSR